MTDTVSESVRLEREGDVSLVIVDNPPVNALSWHVRQGLFDGITKATEDGAKAIVVICDGRTFIAGADISEFGGGAPQAVGLQEVQAAMEDAPVPVDRGDSRHRARRRARSRTLPRTTGWRWRRRSSVCPR